MSRSQIKMSFVFIFIFSYACEKTSNIDDKESSPELIYNSLLEAYKDSCISCLEQVLIDWESKYNSNTDIIDSLQDVYDVYSVFYRPWELALISESEFGEDIYEGISYYIIQSEIKYDYCFRTYGNEKIVIEDFRPLISNDSINLLYLNSDYDSAINCFLGSDYATFGSGMSPAFSVDETNKRYYFLNNYLKFFHGHWGNYWHLETHPEVSSISFNASKDSAQVKFRLGYQGGEVILGKENNSWKIVDHYMTWIE